MSIVSIDAWADGPDVFGFPPACTDEVDREGRVSVISGPKAAAEDGMAYY
ncbi:hypothetical protein FHW84_000016 [Dyella sp. SG562]|nr:MULTISPECIES: hypothetical protein [unclassified Dyella]NII71460.1 hypothetical protein [Dyella sp. SG562]NKJ22073.1 hypothetical protein [Dyella sp. SG609]